MQGEGLFGMLGLAGDIYCRLDVLRFSHDDDITGDARHSRLAKRRKEPVMLLGLKVEIGRTDKKGRLVADIHWRGFRIAKVFIKEGVPVARVYCSKRQGAEAIPLDSMKSAIGLAESRLKGFTQLR